MNLDKKILHRLLSKRKKAGRSPGNKKIVEAKIASGKDDINILTGDKRIIDLPANATPPGSFLMFTGDPADGKLFQTTKDQFLALVLAAAPNTSFIVAQDPADGKLKKSISLKAWSDWVTTNFTVRQTTADDAYNAKLGTGFNGEVRAIVGLSDGTTLVGGKFTQLNGVPVGRLAKLLSDGTPDTAFNTKLGTGFDSDVYAIARQSDDGKILVGGHFNHLNGVQANRLARLNADGTPDTAFNTNGSQFDNDVYAIAAYPQSGEIWGGKIYVGGLFRGFGGAGSLGGFLSLNADGTPNTSFNTALGPNGVGGNVNAILLREPLIYIGGNFRAIGSTPVAQFVRLNASGAVDVAFNAGLGTGFKKDPGDPNDGEIFSLLFYNDNIFVGGRFSLFNGVASKCIVRILNDNGTRDTTFTSPIQDTNSASSVNAIVLSIFSSSIFIGGQFSQVDGLSVPGFAKILPDGSGDATYNLALGVSGGNVYAIKGTVNIRLSVGGSFTFFGNKPKNYFTRLFETPFQQTPVSPF